MSVCLRRKFNGAANVYVFHIARIVAAIPESVYVHVIRVDAIDWNKCALRAYNTCTTRRAHMQPGQRSNRHLPNEIVLVHSLYGTNVSKCEVFLFIQIIPRTRGSGQSRRRLMCMCAPLKPISLVGQFL